MFDFERLNTAFGKKKKSPTLNGGENSIFHILFHQLSIDSINFDSFTLRDINEVIENTLPMSVTYLEENEEYLFHEGSPFYAMSSNYNMICMLNDKPLKRPARRRRFL